MASSPPFESWLRPGPSGLHCVPGDFFIDPAGQKHALFGSGGGILTAEKLGTTLLGQVPLLPSIREGGDAGLPIVVSAPASPAAEVFRGIAQTLLDRLAAPRNRTV